MKFVFKLTESVEKEQLDLLYSKKIAWKFAENHTTAIVDVEKKEVSFFSGETIFGIIGPWKIDIISNEDGIEKQIVFETQTVKMAQIFKPQTEITVDFDTSTVKAMSPLSTLEFLVEVNPDSTISDIESVRESLDELASKTITVDLNLKKEGRMSKVFAAIKKVASIAPITQINSDSLTCMVPRYIIYQETIDSIRESGDEVTVTKPFYINQFMLNILTAFADLSDSVRLIDTEDGHFYVLAGTTIKAQFSSIYDMQDAYDINEAMPTRDELKHLYPNTTDESYDSFTCKLEDLLLAASTISSIASSVKMNTEKYHLGKGVESYALKAKKDPIMEDMVLASYIGVPEEQEAVFNEQFAIPVPSAIESLCTKENKNATINISFDKTTATAVKVGVEGDDSITCLLSKDFS